MIEDILGGLQEALLPSTLLAILIGVLLGTLVGILPGLSSPTAVAILLPVTYSLSPVAALSMLAAIWYGSSFGGIITSVLLKIPGEGDSVIATLDGHAMAKQGKARVALGVSAIGGAIAGTVGLIGLMFLGPTIAELAKQFGPPENFALMLLGLSLIVWLSGQTLARGLISAGLGLIIGMIGTDVITGTQRLTFGTIDLLGGIEFAVVVVGLFGLGEVLATLTLKSEVPASGGAMSFRLRGLLPARGERKGTSLAVGRGSLIGFVIGAIPGAGPSVATFVSYAVEKKSSKRPETFGHGAIEGVAGPQSAAHSATISGLIPLLSLGLPASATAAILFGGFLIHGVVPGPQLFEDHPIVVWGLILGLWIANILLLVLNTALIPLLIKLLEIVRPVLPAVIGVFVLLGAFTLGNSVFDIGLALAAGVLGYFFRLFGVPLAPFVIALILGPQAEVAVRQSLIISGGSPTIFFSSVFASVLVVAALIILIGPALGRFRRPKFLPTTEIETVPVKRSPVSRRARTGSIATVDPRDTPAEPDTRAQPDTSAQPGATSTDSKSADR